MSVCPSAADNHQLVGDRDRGSRESRLGRILSTLSNSAARKSFASVLDQAVVSGTSFATCVIIGRLCSREELGVYALALGVVRFILGVQDALVCVPYVVKNVHRQGDELAAYIGSTLLFQVLLTALGVVGLLVLLQFLNRGIGPVALAPVVWALTGVLPFLALREFVRQLTLCKLHLTALLVIDMSVSVFQLGGLLFLGYWQILSVTNAYLIAGSGCGLACLGWFLAGGQRLRLAPKQVVEDWRQNWSFARWVLAAFCVGATTPFFMPWILALVHGEGATGVLAACSTLVNGVSTFVTGMTNLVGPLAVAAFVRDGDVALRRILRNTALLFLVTVGVFCLFIFASGDLPIRLLFGSKYAGCGLVLTLLALTALANSLCVTAAIGLSAIGRPWANFLADVCCLLVTWMILFNAVGPLGAVGAAMALLAGASCGATVRAALLMRGLAVLQNPPRRDYA